MLQQKGEGQENIAKGVGEREKGMYCSQRIKFQIINSRDLLSTFEGYKNKGGISDPP